jgi:hypothetical protein
MKTILFFAFIAIFSTGAFAGNIFTGKAHVPSVNTSPLALYKKVDITIHSGGYTIHIVGNANYNVFTGNLSMTATITISWSGGSIDLPFTYSGPMNKGKGVFTNPYDSKEVAAEDKEVTDLVVSHIYLPADKDYKKIKIQ